uniref:non-specific serine/threonine protein kinase n=1 Tax=Xiphophorus maculatus TaxID=8083 RepID=A0A3B5QBC3_XIPMA
RWVSFFNSFPSLCVLSSIDSAHCGIMLLLLISKVTTEHFNSFLHLLGKGGYGSVFAGHREVDKLPVGVFGILKMRLCENGREMALEVAIMLKLKNLTSSSSGQLATVSLLDWYELEEELLIVMERPTPSQDLNDYLDENGGCLNEEESKVSCWMEIRVGFLNIVTYCFSWGFCFIVNVIKSEG